MYNIVKNLHHAYYLTICNTYMKTKDFNYNNIQNVISQIHTPYEKIREIQKKKHSFVI